jgi:hypothetical protein
MLWIRKGSGKAKPSRLLSDREQRRLRWPDVAKPESNLFAISAEDSALREMSCYE